MSYLTRAQWGAPALTGNALLTTPKSNRRGVIFHWDGGATPMTAAESLNLLRAYDRHHRNQGWGGIGYNLAVCPVSGDVIEARGLDRIGAHAGGANTANLGVILIGGPGNLTEAAKRGMRVAYEMCNAYTGRTLAPGVHSDINSTSCPGDDIRAFVKNGGLTLGYNATSRPTEEIQRLVGATPDGIYGPDTTAKVKAWQKANGLTPDGIWGPLSDAKGFPPTPPTPDPDPIPDGKLDLILANQASILTELAAVKTLAASAGDGVDLVNRRLDGIAR